MNLVCVVLRVYSCNLRFLSFRWISTMRHLDRFLAKFKVLYALIEKSHVQDFNSPGTLSGEISKIRGSFLCDFLSENRFPFSLPLKST